MSTIEKQIELEQRMVAHGIDRYHTQVNKAIQGEREGDLPHAQRLLGSYIPVVAEAIEAFTGGTKVGVKAKYKSLLMRLNAYEAAYIGLRCFINHLSRQESIATLGLHVGTALEDNLKFSKFSDEHPDYYNKIIEDFKQKGTTNYKHMHRVLTFKANEKEVEWEDWTPQERAAVGIKLIDIINEVTGLANKVMVRKGKTQTAILVPSDTAKEWIDKFHKFAEELNPDRLPCVIEPDEWTAPNQGGYYTPQMRTRTPLVKTRNKQHKALLNTGMERVFNVVNNVQKVQWRINSKVLDVMQTAWTRGLPLGFPQSQPYDFPPCPIGEGVNARELTGEAREQFDNWKSEMKLLYRMERERLSKTFSITRALRIANEFKDYERFWFVWQTDFRGRLYCSSIGINPQGPDFVKGLLEFANPEPLSEAGLRWLRIHGANTYGVDKVSFEERIQWVIDNEKHIREVYNDPLTNRSFWANADAPWQFLAFCMEYGEYLKHGLGVPSRIVVSVDGSCNGLQNFSAMLRDEVGGKATNLLPSNKPEDIYGIIAGIVTGLVRSSQDASFDVWKGYIAQNPTGLPRGLTKRPVMTLPYGSTKQSCTAYICQWIMEDKSGYFKAHSPFKQAQIITPLVWQAIGQTVVAARSAMGWLQRCASILAKENKPIVWWTPMGFPVYQSRNKLDIKQIHTELMGHFRLRLGVDTDRIDSMKQRLGVSPNFVHSMDACHLMGIVEKLPDHDIQDIACVHDSFGVHANKVDTLQKIIRTVFVNLYEGSDPLAEFKRMMENAYGVTLPPLPSKGNLDLSLIHNSLYFFA